MDDLITTIPKTGRVPSGETDLLPEPPVSKPLDIVDATSMAFRMMMPHVFKSQIPADEGMTKQPTMHSSRY